MDNNGRPNHIEDYLVKLHTGQWFGFKNLNGNDANKTYANLVIHDDSKTKPTEQECIDGLAQLQSDFDSAETQKETNKSTGKQKLKDLGLDDAEIEALMGV
tara:strand:+ start:115 stop:417 length:303 start_codon:yes stop_codon:yes gene_type:complete